MPKSPRPSKPKFQLPRNGAVYISSILERSHYLISTKIWSGISPTSLDAWVANFQTDTERYLAACILDGLIYRSEEQVIALMRQVMNREIPTCLLHAGQSDSPFNNLKAYFEQPPAGRRPIALVPVIRTQDPPTKSGPMIARLLKRHLEINQYHMLWPWHIKQWISQYGTSHFIFVDDLLGTGRQFKRFAEEFNLEDVLINQSCIYTPLVAHTKGIAKLRLRYPKLAIHPVETLSLSHNVFHGDSQLFNDGVNTPELAKEFYRDILRRTGYENIDQSSGYGNLGLVYAFQHGTPNNSLPILWYSASSWNPLLKR